MTIDVGMEMECIDPRFGIVFGILKVTVAISNRIDGNLSLRVLFNVDPHF